MTTTAERTTAAVAAITQMQRRVIQDALNEATSAYWLARAAQFEAARPRSTDNHGRASRAALRVRDAALAATAQACRNKATLCDLSPVEAALIESEV